jgi:hypothetical protein
VLSVYGGGATRGHDGAVGGAGAGVGGEGGGAGGVGDGGCGRFMRSWGRGGEGSIGGCLRRRIRRFC